MTGFVIPAVWSMIAGAWLATGAIHLTAALKPPRARARLAFSALAACATTIAIFQLMLLNADDAVQSESLSRWMHVPMFAMVLVLLLFTRAYFDAGRTWLAGATCGVGIVALVAGLSPQVHADDSHPWGRLDDATIVVLAAYIGDAARACWRRGSANEQRRAMLGGASLVAALGLVALGASLQSHALGSAYAYAIASALVLVTLGSKVGARWISAQDRFRLVLDAASNGLIMVDAAGRIVLANARAARIFGCPPEDLAHAPIESLIPGAHLDGESGAAKLLAMAGDEVSGRRKDGTQFPLALGVTSIEGSDGIAALVSIVDLTERKRDAEILRRERAFLRQVIDTDPNLIFAKDRDGRFTLANKAVADMYGTTVDDLIGRTDAHFNHDASEVAAFRRDDLRVMETRGELFIAEERITDAVGEARYLQTVKRPIVGEDGVANQVLGVSTDVSARKAAELQLGLQRNELAHLSRVTMLAELSGSMAHELNQPLTAILSNAQAGLRFLERDTVSLDELRAILEDIVADDKRAGHVIAGLRMLLMKGEMKREDLQVNAAVEDVLRILHSDLVHVGVDARVEAAPDLPAVRGDRVQIQQVLLNLVVNACDAMSSCPVPERRLLVSTVLDEGFVRVSVADRGQGIAREHAEKIFQPFYTTKEHGLGMGLAICRNIVSTHGGRLWAADNEGGGTQFNFTLPVAGQGLV
jgi:PAS domain S-box-containing protein